jgi:nucleoside-diphosphate-sugar epimerase
MLRKVAEAKDGDEIEVWGSGTQTRSFLYIDDCVDAIRSFMSSNFTGPVNIGSEEMVSINKLAEISIKISKKHLTIKNLDGIDFYNKYGFKVPLGVNGRNSHNKLFIEKIGLNYDNNLIQGLEKTYPWINAQVNK